jgi:hypothetical protein
LGGWGWHYVLVVVGRGQARGWVIVLVHDIAGFIAKTLGSSEGIDEALGVDGPEAKLKGGVEEGFTGL